MKIIFNIKYLLIVFCLLNTNFAYSTSILPPLRTYDEKLAFLLHVYKEIPNLFEDSGIYGVNLFTVLDNEVEVVELLKQHPRFEELYLEKKYLNISVKPTADIWVGEVKIKLEAIEDWKKNIHDKIQIAKKSFLTPDELLKGINTKEILAIDPSETLSNIKFIKINKKDKLVDEELNNQFAICKRIPEMIKKFQCIKNNYDKINKLPTLPSIEEIDSIIAGITHEEKVFLQLYLAAVLKKNTNAPTPVNWEEFANSIAQLNGEDLIYLNDKDDVLKPILATYFDKENEPRFLRALKLIHNKEIKYYASNTISKQTKVTSEVELMEVPPQIGIFRGSVGGDCSTQFSFPYPNDPHERVFYIKTKKLGRVYKGYVSATEVMVGAEKALYVITISGAHVSAQDVELIFRGFEKAKDTLGVKHIILPRKDNISALINFPNIKASYENHIKKSTRKVNIVYQDEEIRNIIERYKPISTYNQGVYDYRHNNKKGVVLSISNNPVNARITERFIPQNSSHSNEDLFDFIKNLRAFKNKEKEIDRLLKSETIKKAFGEKGKTIIDNLFLLLDSCGGSDVLSVQQFKKEINNTLISLGLGKNYLDSNPDLMVPGYFKCQDAFFNNNLEEAAMLIAENIKIHQDESSLLTLIKDHSVNLNTTSAFKKLNKRYYEKLSDPDADTRKIAIKIFENTMPTDPEIHRALVQLLKDVDVSIQAAAAETLKVVMPTDPGFYKALIRDLFLLRDDIIAPKNQFVSEIVISVQPTNNETMLEIAKLLQDKNEYTNVKAIKYFSLIEPTKDPEILRALVQALGDNDRLVACHAASTIANIKPTDPEIHKAIAQFLLSNNVLEKRAAAWVLSEIMPTDPEVHRALVQALNDDNYDVRERAAQALKEIRLTDEIFNMTREEAAKFYKALIAAQDVDLTEKTSLLIYGISNRILSLLTSANNDAIYEIANQLQSEKSTICYSASNIIAEINPVDQETYFNVLLSLWYNNGPVISRKTDFIIKKIKLSDDKKKYFDLIWFILNHESDYVRERAVNMLTDIQPEYIKSVDNEMYFNFLWKLLNYSNDYIREKAIDMIEYIKPVGHKIYITFLWNMLNYDNYCIHQKAADMFKLIKFEDIKSVEHQIYFNFLLFMFKHDNIYFSDTATDILRKIKLQSSNFYPNLIKNLIHNDCSVREKLANAIIKIKPEDPEIVNEIEKLLNHENEEIVALAKNIIAVIKPTDVVEQ